MRYTAQQTEQTRQNVMEAASRQFREHGYGGIGVDGLTKAAGVTPGAFYSQFRSKAEAFRAVAVAGLERLRAGVSFFQKRDGDKWFEAFTAFYLSRNQRDDVGGSCALPSLSGSVGRAEEATRAAYQAELTKVAETLAAGLPGTPGREAAWPVLAQLAGGVLLARAVKDEALAQEIADAVLAAVQRRAD